MPRALLSVSDKTGLTDLARGLAARGYELVSTGGTAAALERAGLPVRAVADVTGTPEMLDGRVKTLHPRVHGGILAQRSRPDHMAALAEHGITPVDIVVVNLYPFLAAAADPATPFDHLVEEIDIGGPSLLRAAAKNFQDVLVVVAPADYGAVLEQLARPDGPTAQFRLDLARKAFAHTAAYDAAITSTLAGVVTEEDGYRRAGDGAAPAVLAPALTKVRDLRYGENPHQRAAWYAEAAHGFGDAQVLQGDEPSYTNLLDLDAALRIAGEFDEPAAVVVKHTNPCGVAIAPTLADAYVRARDADRLSSFGGIVALNRAIDVEAARAIVSTKIDGVVAPGVSADALPVLGTKPRMRVLTVRVPEPGKHGRELRSILGGVLLQDRDRVVEAGASWPSDDLRVVTDRHPTETEWRALRFAWRVCAHVKSNAVIFTSADCTLAVGAGQMSRVDAVVTARMKAEASAPGSLKGSVAASDAFFPFRDGLDAVAAAGATAVIAPGGSLRDKEVIGAANEQGLTMVFAAKRHFRH